MDDSIIVRVKDQTDHGLFPPINLFRRTGTCDGCKRDGLRPGQCCEYVVLPLSRSFTKDEKHWLELHGIRMEGDDHVRIEARCKELTEEGDCGLHGEPERPELCARWPLRPQDAMPPGCVYEFEPVSLTEVLH